MTWLAIPLGFIGFLGFIVAVGMLGWATIEHYRARAEEWSAVQEHRQAMRALRPPRVLP